MDGLLFLGNIGTYNNEMVPCMHVKRKLFVECSLKKHDNEIVKSKNMQDRPTLVSGTRNEIIHINLFHFISLFSKNP